MFSRLNNAHSAPQARPPPPKNVFFFFLSLSLSFFLLSLSLWGGGDRLIDIRFPTGGPLKPTNVKREYGINPWLCQRCRSARRFFFGGGGPSSFGTPKPSRPQHPSKNMAGPPRRTNSRTEDLARAMHEQCTTNSPSPPTFWSTVAEPARAMLRTAKVSVSFQVRLLSCKRDSGFLQRSSHQTLEDGFWDGFRDGFWDDFLSPISLCQKQDGILSTESSTVSDRCPKTVFQCLQQNGRPWLS